ncbi:MAG: hypothetical protein QM831_17645 [Kofleriaceae bacterium]
MHWELVVAPVEDRPRRRTKLVHWGDGWSVVVDAKRLVIARGERSVRVAWFPPVLVGDIDLHDDALWIGQFKIATRELERIFELAPAELEISVQTVFPVRIPTARVVGRVIANTTVTSTVQTPRAQVTVYAVLEIGTEIALVDEYMPGWFAAYDVAELPRQRLPMPEPFRLEATCTVGKVRAPEAPIPRDPHLVALLGEADRDVLIDLLADRGHPCAHVFAELRAGERATPAKKRAALGALAPVFDDVTFEHGLPYAAKLARDAKLVDDVRLGLLHELRIGRAPIETYVAFIRSRALESLRACDAPTFEVLRALYDADHRDLEQLYDVRFVEPAAMALLADPAFASVRHLELRVELRFARALLQRLADDDFGVFRHERHLVLVERHDKQLALRQLVSEAGTGIKAASVTVA